MIHECTSHTIVLCPEVKYIINIKKAEMAKTRGSTGICDAIVDMVFEWQSYKTKYGELEKK